MEFHQVPKPVEVGRSNAWSLMVYLRTNSLGVLIMVEIRKIPVYRGFQAGH
jgi:hypothetical protein